MILQHLREQTQAHHKRLEFRLDLLPATLSLERYCTLLKRFYNFYAPVEMHLER